MARARLFSPLGVTRGTSVDVDDVATIGRDHDHALVIDDGLISKDHARIAFDSAWGGFLLEDLGSTNGTALDGVPVIGRERLDRLHVITFAGRHDFVFQDLRAAAGSRAASASPDLPVPSVEPPASTPPAARPDDPVTEPLEVTRHGQRPVALPQALADVLDPAGAVERTRSHELPPPIPDILAGAAESADGAAPVPVEEEEPLSGSPSPYLLEVRFHEGRPERFALRYGDNLVGRISSAEIQLKNDHISRRHAVLSVGRTIMLRDRGSNNHTFVGGERVEGEARVRIGDLMRFGPLEARLIRLDQESR